MASKNPPKSNEEKTAVRSRKLMEARLLEFELETLSDRIDSQTANFVESSREDLATKEQMESIIGLLEKWSDAETRRSDIIRTLS